MATTEELAAWIVKNADKKGTPEFDIVSRAYQASKTSQVKAEPAKYDPTEGMSTTERTFAGIGSGMTDLVYGAGQRLGLVDQATINEKRRLDAPLKATRAGAVGSVTGKVALGLPAVLIPGANTLTGAAVIGGTQGAIEPTTEDESVLKNTAIGAGAGVLGVMAGRAVRAGYQGLKGLIQPFTKSGQDQIAARTLERFATDPAAVKTATSNATATGARPTLSEATKDTGIATLERALAQQDPQVAAKFAQRAAENNAARVGVVQNIAGDEAKRAAAVAARKTATAPLYENANKAEILVDAELQSLLSRPSVQRALGRAGNIAGEQGRTFGLSAQKVQPASAILDSAGNPVNPEKVLPGKITGQTLQDIKMSLDDLLKDPASGMAGKEGAAVKETRNKIVEWMERHISDFGAARKGWAEGTKPLNQMDVGQRLLEKTTGAIRDMGGNPRLQANAFSRALNDEKGLVRGATGFKGLNELEQVMSPEQMNAINAVRNELELAANLQAAANGPGSQTAKSLASQNLMRQILGPTGLPESWAESTLLETLMRPAQFGMKVAEPRIQNRIAEILLDPNQARAVLQQIQTKPLSPAAKKLLPLLQQAAQQSATATALVSGER